MMRLVMLLTCTFRGGVAFVTVANEYCGVFVGVFFVLVNLLLIDVAGTTVPLIWLRASSRCALFSQ